MTTILASSCGDSQERGLYVIYFDKNKLTLTIKDFCQTVGLPSYIMTKNNYNYVTFKNNNLDQGAGIGIYQYSDKLKELDLYNSYGRSYCHLCVDNDEKYLFTANYNIGATAFYLLDNHKIVKKLNSFHHVGSGPDPLKRQIGPHAHYVGFTPEYKYLYSVDLGADKVFMFHYQNETLEEQNHLNVLPGSGPRQMIFSNDGRFAYLINEISNRIFVYKYVHNHFLLIQSFYTTPRHFTGFSSAASIKMSKSGNHLFVSNRGHDSIAMYRVNKDNGKLSLLYMVHTSKDPVDFTIIDDQYLVIACYKGNKIQVMSFDEDNEKLELLPVELDIKKPSCLCNNT